MFLRTLLLLCASLLPLGLQLAPAMPPRDARAIPQTSGTAEVHGRVVADIFSRGMVTSRTTEAGAQAPAPREGATATIRGTVTDAATGKPLPMVRVRLVGLKPSAVPDHHTRTDPEGRYEFRDVAPRQVVIIAAKARYMTLQHGQALPATDGRPIEVTAGALLERIDIALPRAAAITGRIVDEFGEPLEHASVEAMQVLYVNGRRRLAPVAGASTNDNGEYRLHALQPGRYYVVAAERRVGFGASMEADIGFAPTAYPAAATIESARPVEVRAGMDTPGVDIALRPAPTAKLSGLVLGRDGQPASGAWAVLQAVDAGPGAGLGGDMRTGPDGRFVFPRVLTGRYELHVRAAGAGGEGAILPVALLDDLDVVVPMVSGRMTGRVVPPPGASAAPKSVTIAIEPVSDTLVFGTGFGGTPREDWTFDFEFLLGARVVRAQRLPDGWSLEGVYRDGKDVTDTVFAFNGNEVVSGIEVVLTTRAAGLVATATRSDGSSCATCTVIAFASDASRWRYPSRFVHAAKANQESTFRIDGLPAAEYLVVAVEGMEDGEWLDPDVLEKLRPDAQPVDLSSGASASLALRVVAR